MNTTLKITYSESSTEDGLDRRQLAAQVVEGGVEDGVRAQHALSYPLLEVGRWDS